MQRKRAINGGAAYLWHCQIFTTRFCRIRREWERVRVSPNDSGPSVRIIILIDSFSPNGSHIARNFSNFDIFVYFAFDAMRRLFGTRTLVVSMSDTRCIQNLGGHSCLIRPYIVQRGVIFSIIDNVKFLMPLQKIERTVRGAYDGHTRCSFNKLTPRPRRVNYKCGYANNTSGDQFFQLTKVQTEAETGTLQGLTLPPDT